MQLPKITTVVFSDTSPIKSELAYEGAPDVVLDPACTDPQSQPGWRFRAGGVVVLRAASRTFVPADDPTGDRNEPATVLALVPADAAWAGKIVKYSIDGGPAFTVPLGAQDNTNALVLATLNKDARFLASLVADELNGLLRVRTLGAGADRTLMINVQQLPAAFGPAGTVVQGADADYRVTLADGDLIDAAGAPAPSIVPSCRRGHFNTEKLRNLTTEAKVVLLRRGAFFD